MTTADNIAEPVSRLFKLLNDPNRLRIILTIGKGSKAVSEIMQETNLPQPLVSFHLRPLRESGMLEAERRGPFVYYRVTEPRLIDLLASLAGVTLKDDEKQDMEFPFPPMRFMRRWMKGG